MSKGIVYSGIAYLPDHPDADLHGLVRACIRERSRLAAMQKLRRAGIPLVGSTNMIWQQSASHVEQMATERHYGEILICPIVFQYLDANNYRPLKAKAPPAAASAKTGMPPRDWQ